MKSLRIIIARIYDKNQSSKIYKADFRAKEIFKSISHHLSSRTNFKILLGTFDINKDNLQIYKNENLYS